MTEKYLAAVGTICIDEYYELDRLPFMGDKVLCHYQTSKPGGLIGNAVSVYASYDIPAYMIDCINTGKQMDFLLEELKRGKVNTDYITRDKNRPDTKCLIMLKDGERMIFVVDHGKKDIALNPRQISLLNGAEFVYSTIVELLALRDYSAIVEGFRNEGTKLVLDLEGNTIKEDSKILALIQQANILFINEGGFEQLQSCFGGACVQGLVESGALAVLTLGAKGCRVLKKGSEYPVFPAMDVAVIDTTGAGDTFNASFLYGLSKGWEIPEIAFFANAAASRSVGILGPRSGAAGEDAVRRFIKEYAEKR